LLEDIIVDHYAKLISPLFTRLFVRIGVTPNRVTILMMVSGVIGAVLFALPYIACRVFGLVFIHLWYVLDCSDGEIARITRRFSKFGTEIDYTAHIVNHPLFNLAFTCGLLSMRRYNPQLVLFASILSISAELVSRNLTAFYYMYKLKMSQEISENDDRLFRKACIHIVNLFAIYPNYVILFPLAYIADYLIGTSFAVCYFFLQTALASLLTIWASYKWVRIIVDV